MADNQNFGAGEDEVVKAEKSRCNALKAGDAKALESLYTDDFVYVHSSGRKEARGSYLSTVTTTDNKFLSFSHSDMKVDVMGEAALMTGTVEMTRDKGKVVFLFAEVWVKSPAGWRLKYQHNTKKDPAAA